jgi:4-amino-4-deoxy-L-arabinose transferase-like glycosyltransferase
MARILAQRAARSPHPGGVRPAPRASISFLRRVSLRLGLVIIAAIAIAVRLAALVATPDLPLTSDPADYDLHARTIADTGGYPGSHFTTAGGPSAVRPPGFTYLLGAVYAVTGDSVTAGRVTQALLGAAAAVLVALIALELFGRRPAIVAGLLTAVFPPLVLDGITLFTEPLFVALELAAVLAVLLWRRTSHFGWVLAAGVATGLAILTRPNALLVLVVLAIAARESGPWRSLRTWRAPAVVTCCALLVVLPWTIRNAFAFDSFVLVSNQDGYTLAGTYNATSRSRDATWIPANLDPGVRALIARNAALDEAATNDELRSYAREFALDHPAYVAEVAGRNTLRLLNLGGQSYERVVARLQYGLGPRWADLMVWSTIPILVLAALGAFTGSARAAPRWIWAVPVLLLTTVFVLAANRHRAGIDPFLLMLSALALVAGWDRFGSRLRPSRAP